VRDEPYELVLEPVELEQLLVLRGELASRRLGDAVELNDLLFMTQIEAGKLDLERAELELAELLRALQRPRLCRLFRGARSPPQRRPQVEALRGRNGAVRRSRPRIALDRLEEALLLVDRSVREPLPEELGIDPDRRFLEPSA
jgi:hypothetical protein